MWSGNVFICQTTEVILKNETQLSVLCVPTSVNWFNLRVFLWGPFCSLTAHPVQSHRIACIRVRDTQMTHQPQGRAVAEKQRE